MSSDISGTLGKPCSTDWVDLLSFYVILGWWGELFLFGQWMVSINMEFGNHARAHRRRKDGQLEVKAKFARIRDLRECGHGRMVNGSPAGCGNFGRRRRREIVFVVNKQQHTNDWMKNKMMRPRKRKVMRRNYGDNVLHMVGEMNFGTTWFRSWKDRGCQDRSTWTSSMVESVAPCTPSRTTSTPLRELSWL